MFNELLSRMIGFASLLIFIPGFLDATESHFWSQLTEEEASTHAGSAGRRILLEFKEPVFIRLRTEHKAGADEEVKTEFDNWSLKASKKILLVLQSWDDEEVQFEGRDYRKIRVHYTFKERKEEVSDDGSATYWSGDEAFGFTLNAWLPPGGLVEKLPVLSKKLQPTLGQQELIYELLDYEDPRNSFYRLYVDFAEYRGDS